MQVLVETKRLVLRRFTPDDVDNLVALDGDPEVMHFVTGGRATPREEIEHDILPAIFRYYERYAGYGFWAAIEKATGEFLGWFHFRPREGHPRTRSSSATACASRRGARGTPPKARGR